MNDKERVIERLKGNKLRKSKFMDLDVEWVSDDGGDIDQILGDTKEDKEALWKDVDRYTK